VATTLAMWLSVSLGNGNGFVELAILESAGHLLYKDARLLARGAVHQRPVNHDAEGINGKNEQDNNYGTRQGAHLGPHGAEGPNWTRMGSRFETRTGSREHKE